MFEIKEIDDAQFAFPATVIGHLLPEWEDIPEEFRKDKSEWCKVPNDWFSGFIVSPAFLPKPGIEAPKAYRHLQACMRSYEPKHQHKIAGVAYLLSQWFEIVWYHRDTSSLNQLAAKLNLPEKKAEPEFIVIPNSKKETVDEIIALKKDG